MLTADQLAYAMGIVGVMTYLVTFDINTMSRSWLRFYHKKRHNIVESMRLNGVTDWKQEARAQTTLFWEPNDCKARFTVKQDSSQPEDSFDKWKIRAERYDNTFHVAREKSDPSEWYISLFTANRAFKMATTWAMKSCRRIIPRAEDHDTAEKGKAHVPGDEETTFMLVTDTRRFQTSLVVARLLVADATLFFW